MQHLQYGNYDIRYMVYVRKMADINVVVVQDNILVLKRRKFFLRLLFNFNMLF